MEGDAAVRQILWGHALSAEGEYGIDVINVLICALHDLVNGLFIHFAARAEEVERTGIVNGLGDALISASRNGQPEILRIGFLEFRLLGIVQGQNIDIDARFKLRYSA